MTRIATALFFFLVLFLQSCKPVPKAQESNLASSDETLPLIKLGYRLTCEGASDNHQSFEVSCYLLDHNRNKLDVEFELLGDHEGVSIVKGEHQVLLKSSTNGKPKLLSLRLRATPHGLEPVESLVKDIYEQP